MTFCILDEPHLLSKVLEKASRTWSTWTIVLLSYPARLSHLAPVKHSQYRPTPTPVPCLRHS